MPKLINLPTYTDSRGSLTVIEKELPFSIKRVYYLYNCSEQERGGHRHKKTIQTLVCLHGSCIVDWDNGEQKGSYTLDKPDNALIIMPEDYHILRGFSKDTVLMVLASEFFDADDYIHEGYR